MSQAITAGIRTDGTAFYGVTDIEAPLLAVVVAYRKSTDTLTRAAETATTLTRAELRERSDSTAAWCRLVELELVPLRQALPLFPALHLRETGGGKIRMDASIGGVSMLSAEWRQSTDLTTLDAHPAQSMTWAAWRYCALALMLFRSAVDKEIHW